jgi:hypothetical protein
MLAPTLAEITIHGLYYRKPHPIVYMRLIWPQDKPVLNTTRHQEGNEMARSVVRGSSAAMQAAEMAELPLMAGVAEVRRSAVALDEAEATKLLVREAEVALEVEKYREVEAGGNELRETVERWTGILADPFDAQYPADDQLEKAKAWLEKKRTELAASDGREVGLQQLAAEQEDIRRKLVASGDGLESWKCPGCGGWAWSDVDGGKCAGCATT